MKTKIKVALAFIGLACAGVTFYKGLPKEQDLENTLLMENMEVLAGGESGESGGSYRYPEKSGDAEFCKLYVYKKGGVEVSRGTEPNDRFEVGVEYTKEVKEGLKDRCPIENGSGCNPYSCQEVPY